jgi:hypothetical protein
MKPQYDIAAEMIKIAESQEHKKLFEPLEKLAFSREGKEEPSEVEAEMRKLEKKANCECKEKGCKDCDCSCHKEEAKADDGLLVGEPEMATATASFPLNTVQTLMKISMQLEAEGLDTVSAAALMLADAVVKEAKKKKEKSKSKSMSKSKGKDEKSKSKKMTPKERMEAMRKAKEKASKSKSKS